MTRYLSLYGSFLGLQWRTMMQYRVNFLVGAASTIAMQIGALVTIFVVMDKISSLHGWTLNQILLLYGLTNLGLAIGHMFTDNLWTLGRSYIRPGGFERFLVRPINPLFHLIADRFCYDGIGDFIIGAVVTGIALNGLGVSWSVPEALYLGIAIFAGGAIFIALNLITCVTAFWIVDSVPVTLAVFQTHQFARYPLPIYAAWIRVLMTWIIPYGLVSFYPASQLTGRNPGLMALVPIGMAILLLVAGYRLWLIGLRHYVGTGS